MFGFINLNKPQGFTSHDCVAKMRRLLNTKKIGHGGTLDPLATGVLPIAVGKATRLLQFLPTAKSYRALIRLGMQTTTDDLEGEIMVTHSTDHLQEQEIRDCLDIFVGEIEQVPPKYSAIKQKGKKLYELARQGIEVEVPKRQVEISKCQLVNFLPGEFLELEVDIDCGPGTYIRAIARDLGDQLGVGGTLANLIRTKSCGLDLASSTVFEDINAAVANHSFELIAPDQLLADLPKTELNLEESKRWCNGQLILLTSQSCGLINQSSHKQIATTETSYLRVYQQEQNFLGIGILVQEQDNFLIRPKIVCQNFEP